MVLKLYNTLTRIVEEFKSLKDGVVTMYSCGPTVYDYAHLGNWRSFILADLLKRVLLYNNYTVKHVMNITDVDDKTIDGSRSTHVSLAAFTKKYERTFLNDLDSLNILPATILTHATEFIPQMTELIQRLIDSGHAYKTKDGVYFKVTSFPHYGQLSKQTIDDNAERDFALWKFETPEDGGNAWDASFGRGRPGWHIECSTMSMSELGEPFDLHTGGSDLMFPHHENEIAQSEAATGKVPFVHYWIHGAFLNIDSDKMSKSLANFYTLRDLAEHHISPLAYRYWLLTSHYRSPVNFTWEASGAAQTTLDKLYDIWRNLGEEIGIVSDSYRFRFLEATNNDLNLPQAIALVWELVRDFNLSKADIKATLLEFDKVLGLNFAQLKAIEIPAEVTARLAEREQARQAKDWSRADQLRQEIEAKGFVVDDTDSGPRLKPKN